MKLITKLKSTALIACAIALCGVFTSSPVNASTMALSITPPYEKISLVPGKQYSSTIKVTNPDDDKAMDYEATVTPYSIDDNNYETPNINTRGARNDLMDWITIDESAITGTIEPHQTTNVNFTINVPENANPGGQYAAITITYAGETSQQGSVGVKSKYQLAYTIYGTVAGDIKEAGDILENNISSFFLDSKIGGTSIVENTGNAHFDATYTLRVFPLFSDEEIYTNEEDPDSWIIMPGTTRFIATTWEETPSIGIFNVEQEVKVFDQISKTSKLVIVMPIWLLLAIVFVIVFWIIWLVMRNKNRKAAGKGKGKSSSKSSSTHTATHSDHKSEKSESSDKPKSPDAE